MRSCRSTLAIDVGSHRGYPRGDGTMSLISEWPVRPFSDIALQAASLSRFSLRSHPWMLRADSWRGVPEHLPHGLMMHRRRWRAAYISLQTARRHRKRVSSVWGCKAPIAKGSPIGVQRRGYFLRPEPPSDARVGGGDIAAAGER